MEAHDDYISSPQLRIEPGILRQPGTVLLDTVRSETGHVHSRLFTNPVAILSADAETEVEGLLGAIDAAVTQGYYVAGYLGYEAGYAWLPIGLPPRRSSMPLAWFGVYEQPWVLTPEEVVQVLDAASPQPYQASPASFSFDPETYAARIAAIKTHIREGDVYQINLTGMLSFALEGDALGIYRAMRRGQQAAYSAWLQSDAGTILSASPELFFRRAGRRITTRPMKGTMRRGVNGAEDAVLRERLAHDEKNRAENLMIVDLLRNDLSVVCEPGSVQVPDLFTIEQYATLFQMTSTVEGHLREGVSYTDLFRALFPCGSVTGAPKISAMQRIHALEATPRGVYCGAIGFISPDQEAVFSVAIRTLVVQEGHALLGAGSGVVWDSHADEEYQECLLKTRFLTKASHVEPPFQLIETMRWQDDRISLLPYHLHRLQASAAYFDYPYDETSIRQAVDEATAGLAADGRYKVRVLLAHTGEVSVTTAELAPDAVMPATITFADVPVQRDVVFYYHKTTRRTHYETAYEVAERAGFGEALLLNEAGEVTEGTRSNLFIRKGDHWYTPPVRCGLLGGVYRHYLLDTLPHASEKVLYPRDLLDADAVYLCNAVRGMWAVSLVPRHEGVME